MKVIRCIVLCVLLVSLEAYAAPNSSEHLIDKIDRLENQILALEKRIADLKQSLNAQASTSSNNASLHSRLLALEEKMRELNGKFEYSDHTFQQILERIRNLSADVDYRFNQFEHKQQTTVPTPVIAQTVAPIKNDQDTTIATSPVKKYENMIDQGKYSKAIVGLEKYINDNKTNNNDTTIII